MVKNMNNDEINFEDVQLGQDKKEGNWIKKDYQEDNFIEPRYNVFLKYVKSNTERFVEAIKKGIEPPSGYILYGIDRIQELIIDSFGKDIYDKISKEMIMKERSDHIPIPDFSKINNRISCLYNMDESFYTVPIDLDYLRKLLRFEDISFQLNYEDSLLVVEEVPKLK